MRKLSAVLVLLMILPLSGCGMNWQDFTSDDGSFSIRLPGKPKKESRNEITPVGSLTFHGYSVDKYNSGWAVMYADMPGGSSYDFDKGIKGVANNLQGTALSSKDITLESFRGKEYEMEIQKPKKGYAAGRIYVVNRRLYHIMVAGTKTRLDSEEVQEFLNSFKLLKK